MALADTFTQPEPAREAIDAMTGPVMLEFGTGWCGFCQAAQPLIAQGFERHAGVRHIKVEDGSGRRLGRSFRVRLWPTLVFLKDGQEISRLVRPADPGVILQAMALIDAAV